MFQMSWFNHQLVYKWWIFQGYVGVLQGNAFLAPLLTITNHDPIHSKMDSQHPGQEYPGLSLGWTEEHRKMFVGSMYGVVYFIVIVYVYFFISAEKNNQMLVKLNVYR